MREIILVGAGGCMRELLWQIKEYNKVHHEYKVLGYVALVADEHLLHDHSCPYLGGDDYLLELSDDVDLVIAIADTNIREKLVEKYRRNPRLHFPVINLSDSVAEGTEIGEGSVISRDTIISTNVRIGSFVFINMDCMLCHDGVIEDFVTLSPRVSLAGDVHIGRRSFVGIRATFIQGINVEDDVIIGGGAMVIRNISGNHTAVGVPAKEIK